MDFPQRIVRRANVDDLPGLKLLWERAGFQVLDIEKHLTEFQLVASLEGDLIGVVALQIEGKNGRLHSEAFSHPPEADGARPLLWERVQNLARNHGLVRVWTLEDSPFWHQAGFLEADTHLLEKLPGNFGDRRHRWFTLSLREDTAQTISIEREFELFQQSQRSSTEQIIAQARRLKTLAYLLTFIVATIAIAGVLFVVFKSRSNPSRTPERPPAGMVQ